MTVAPLAASFLAGLACRRARPGLFPLVFRAQLVVLASTMTFLAGWTFDGRGAAYGAMALLVAVDLAALGAGALLVRRGTVPPVAAASAPANTGFWSIPVAGALYGPAGAAFAVVHDTLGAIRGAVIVRLLRRHAPVRPPARSALVDYLPQAGLVAGLLVGTVATPPDAGAGLRVLGLVLGGSGFALLGMAMPTRWPERADWAGAVPSLGLRFGLAAAAFAVASLAGMSLPGAAWVVALAPTPFAVVAFAHLYGYRREQAATVALLSVPIALVLLPVVARLGA